MNKSLKFLTIGLALAVLLVSQVGINRTAEALPVSSELSNDKVVLAGDLEDPATRTEQKDFYKPGDTVNFYLKDPDLRELPVNSRTTVKFTLAVGNNWDTNDVVSLAGTNDPNDDPDSGYDRSPTGGDTDSGALGGGVSTSTRYVNYAPGGDPGATPLVGRPDITVRNADQRGQDGSPFVLTYNPEFGTLTFPASVNGQSAEEDNLNTPDVDESHASTTIEIAFEYDVADVFTADQGAASDAPRTVNRAKVTSSSDGIGAWVTITEIVGIGDTDKDARSNVYHGSIGLTGNSREASQSRDDKDESNDKVWVRDGDTLTVTYYDADHTTIIDTDTATIDAENPSISGISPSGGTVTKDSSPVVSFMVTDDGSGFNTSRPRDHVELFVVDPVGGADCRINDDLLTATRLSVSEVEILFRNTENGGGWITGGGLNCVNDTGAFARKEIVDSISPSDNNHGIQFEIRIEAEDRAGNKANDGKGASVKVTIDTRKPAFDDNNVLTGKNWDVAKKKETTDRAAIKIAFTEALQADSVDASDFTVEDPDVSVESAVLGGVNVEDGTLEQQQLNEIVYLTLSDELPSDSRPKVELDGSVLDKAGNELTKDSVARVEDGVSPGVTVDLFAAQLLADKGEAAVTFSADENLAANAATLDNECTCLAITGPVDGGIEKGSVALPTPSSATYTFKARSGVTGIYGFMVQASDSRANLTQEGAEPVSNEKVTDFTVDGTAVTFKLKKWPLAAPVGDNGLTGDMKAAVKVRKNSETAKFLADDPTSTTTAEVTSIDWGEAGTVTMTLMDAGGDVAVKAATDEESGDTLYVSYSYVKAEQTIEVDVDKPVVDEFSPMEETQDSRPFIRIKWDETEYAGDTHTTVTVTSATLTGPDDFEMVLVDDEMDLLSTSDWKLYSYLPESDLALGEYTITAVGRDAAGNVSEAQSGKFKVVARPPVSIPLNLGWNLVSLPAEPANSGIDAVINVDEVTQVLTYDPTVEGGWLAAVRVNGAFEGGLTNIDATKAYLVYTTSVDPLKVDIPGLDAGYDPVFPPTIQLAQGMEHGPGLQLGRGLPEEGHRLLPDRSGVVERLLLRHRWSAGRVHTGRRRATMSPVTI